VSPLAATLRYSSLVSDPSALALALDLAEYGRRLSPRLQFEGAPPFERTFEDHLRFLRALLGHDVEEAFAHFRSKAEASEGDDLEFSIPSQVLVNLLVRLGRPDEASDGGGCRLGRLPRPAPPCPR